MIQDLLRIALAFAIGRVLVLVITWLAIYFKLATPAPEQRLRVMVLLEGFKEGRYGLDLVKSSGGKLKRGHVYITLGYLEQRGLVERAPDPSNRPRYKLTNKGATVLRLLREDGTI